MQAQQNDPKWLKAAFADLGIHEVKGKTHNKRVVEMFRVAGHPEIKDDETAWCSAAVNAWVVEAGLKGTEALNARSWLKWGRAADTAKTIPRGAVLIFKRGNSAWQGHVCLCLEDNGRTLTVIGGNQSDSVSVARYSRDALIGARMPDTVSNSVTIKSAVTSGGAQVAAQAVDQAAKTVEKNADALATAIDATKSDITPYVDYLTYGKWALVALSLAGLALVAYRFISRHLKPAAEPDHVELEYSQAASIDDDDEEAAPKRGRK